MMSEALWGVWELQRADSAMGLEPGAIMAFMPNGELRYAAPSTETVQVALLTYRVEGAWIVSNQPSAPREERTRFHFEGPDRLVLTYDSGSAYFVRAAASDT